MVLNSLFFFWHKYCEFFKEQYHSIGDVILVHNQKRAICGKSVDIMAQSCYLQTNLQVVNILFVCVKSHLSAGDIAPVMACAKGMASELYKYWNDNSR